MLSHAAAMLRAISLQFFMGKNVLQKLYQDTYTQAEKKMFYYLSP